MSDKSLSTHSYTTEQATRPLRGLRAPLGVLAVLGNHDYARRDPLFAATLRHNGITVLRNSRVNRGGLVVAGIDDVYTGRPDVHAAFEGLSLNQSVVAVGHSPDIIPMLPPSARLVLTGHTHCGQIALPFLGPISYATRTGKRYGCGHIREGNRDVFVSAGLGTSIVPLRLNAPPDLWLLKVVPMRRKL